MKTYKLSELSSEAVRDLCERNPINDLGLLEFCQEVFEDIRKDGDQAVRRYTQKFDGADLKEFSVDGSEFSDAIAKVSDSVMESLKVAARNISRFHSNQQVVEAPIEVEKGISCWRASRPIRSVGLYVPGGTAVLPSTVLMLGVPAKIAGCQKIIMCVPPRSDGTVAPEVIAAAHVAGVRQVFKIGGAQAIAALALGTESVPRVEKILGPGNRYVQTAKLLATFYGTSIDMIAGPSEVLVIADESSSPAIIASDLISQAEHGSDSQVVLVTTSEEIVNAVEKELDTQLSDLPRSEMARESLRGSFSLLVDNLESAFDFSNRYAPEHLILSLENAKEWLGFVQSAGSVFVGKWSPEVAGDYASGTNHTLPTSGSARSVSGVSIDSYVKKITFQQLTREGLKNLSPTLRTLAEVENLEGHSRAVKIRMKKFKEEE